MNKAVTKMNIRRTRRAARVRAKISGTSTRPRLSVFRSNSALYAQLIDDTKGATLFSLSTSSLKLSKKTPTEAAKLLGEAIAEKAKALGVSQAVFDRGKYAFHGRVKAVAEGAKEKGLTI